MLLQNKSAVIYGGGGAIGRRAFQEKGESLWMDWRVQMTHTQRPGYYPRLQPGKAAEAAAM